MSFLNWRKNNPDSEQTSGSQLDIFGNAQALPERQRVDGAIVNKDFNRALSRHEVDAKGRAIATEAVTKGVLGCGTNQLYQETGATKNKRHTLPTEAQKALIVGEVAATHALNETPELSGNQQQINAQAAEISGDAAKKARSLFPWG